MIALELFRWWYGAGWRQLFKRTNRHFTSLGEAFSAGTLLKTLFMPWKRVVTYPGAGLDAHFKAFLDNLVSRGIGFVVRFFVLIGFLLMAALTLIYNVLLLIAWPLVPLAAAAALIKGLMP